MIRLCKSLFYEPKFGSDADSIILMHLFSTVTIVLVCLAAISLSAYAFFSHSVTSGFNTIQASNFSTTVTIKASDNTIITQGKIQKNTFAPGIYSMTITRDSGANGTGFCMVRIGEKSTYYTQQLGRDLNAPGQERTQVSFALDVKATTTVAFESRWGTTSYYSSTAESEFYIKNSDPMQVIVIEATQSIADEEAEEEETKQEEDSLPEETAPEESVPEETTPEETIPEESTPEESIPEESTAPTEHEVITYIVASGDYLSTISAKYGMHHTRLAAYNGILPPYEIHPGDVIKIPPEDWVEPTVPTEVTE